MDKLLRVKCSCGHVMNALPGGYCAKCKAPLNIETDGMILLYRKGSPFGIAGGFGIYLNGEPMGYVGNREMVRIPVKYGSYNLHVAAGLNRKCNDLKIFINPEHPNAYTKVWLKPGFLTNSFVLEWSTPEEMPLDR